MIINELSDEYLKILNELCALCCKDPNIFFHPKFSYFLHLVCNKLSSDQEFSFKSSSMKELNSLSDQINDLLSEEAN